MDDDDYSWFTLEKVLVTHFKLTVEWSVTAALEFRGPHGSVAIPKQNRYAPEHVEAFLGQLGIRKSDFDLAYDEVMNKQARL